MDADSMISIARDYNGVRVRGGRLNCDGSTCGTALDTMYGAGYYAPQWVSLACSSSRTYIS